MAHAEPQQSEPRARDDHERPETPRDAHVADLLQGLTELLADPDLQATEPHAHATARPGPATETEPETAPAETARVQADRLARQLAGDLAERELPPTEPRAKRHFPTNTQSFRKPPDRTRTDRVRWSLMPWTLWRYAALELWRLVLLSAAVLVFVIAFAVTVKPLADGTLGPAEALRFMTLAVVPMLAYALPFAAAFGTTLAYHRMAQDNEVVAAQAGGISHRSLVGPAVISGALLAVALTALNGEIIPRFLARMERMITLDAIDVMIQKIDQGDAATFGDLVVRAAHATSVPLDAASELAAQYRLDQVAALETDEAGNVTDDATAERAWVMLIRGDDTDPDATFGRIFFENGTLNRQGSAAELGQFLTPLFRVPSPFEDDPKFKTSSELHRLRAHPQDMDSVRVRHARLARRLAAQDARTRLTRDLEETDGAKLVSPGVTIIMRADGVRGPATGPWTLEPVRTSAHAEPRVVLEVYAAGADGRIDPTRVDRIAAAGATMTAEEIAEANGVALAAPGSGRQALRYTLELTDAEIRGPAGITTSLATREYAGLRLENDPLASLAAKSPRELIEVAENRLLTTGSNPPLEFDIEYLEEQLRDLSLEITSKQHERLAMSVACLVMVLTGAVTALRLRHAPPLVVYLWSFFPALGAIILISVGQQTVHNEGIWLGLPVLWGGVLGLTGYALFTLARLSRH